MAVKNMEIHEHIMALNCTAKPILNWFTEHAEEEFFTTDTGKEILGSVAQILLGMTSLSLCGLKMLVEDEVIEHSMEDD